MNIARLITRYPCLLLILISSCLLSLIVGYAVATWDERRRCRKHIDNITGGMVSRLEAQVRIEKQRNQQKSKTIKDIQARLKGIISLAQGEGGK